MTTTAHHDTQLPGALPGWRKTAPSVHRPDTVERHEHEERNPDFWLEGKLEFFARPGRFATVRAVYACLLAFLFVFVVAAAAADVPPVVTEDVRLQKWGEERTAEVQDEGVLFYDADGVVYIGDGVTPGGKAVCVGLPPDLYSWTNDVSANGHALLWGGGWSQQAEGGSLLVRLGTNSWLRFVAADAGTLANLAVSDLDQADGTMRLTADTADPGAVLLVATNLLDPEAWQPATNAQIVATTDASTTWLITLLDPFVPEFYRVRVTTTIEAGIHAERTLHANAGIEMGGTTWTTLPDIGAIATNAADAAVAPVASDLADHVADTNNPHRVTFRQVWAADVDDLGENFGMWFSPPDGCSSIRGFGRDVSLEEGYFWGDWNFDERPLYNGAGLATTNEAGVTFDDIASMLVDHGLEISIYPGEGVSSLSGWGDILSFEEGILQLGQDEEFRFGGFNGYGTFNFATTNRPQWQGVGLATTNDLNAHVSDTDNPHGVTLAQLDAEDEGMDLLNKYGINTDSSDGIANLEGFGNRFSLEENLFDFRGDFYLFSDEGTIDFQTDGIPTYHGTNLATMTDLNEVISATNSLANRIAHLEWMAREYNVVWGDWVLDYTKTNWIPTNWPAGHVTVELANIGTNVCIIGIPKNWTPPAGSRLTFRQNRSTGTVKIFVAGGQMDGNASTLAFGANASGTLEYWWAETGTGSGGVWCFSKLSEVTHYLRLRTVDGANDNSYSSRDPNFAPVFENERSLALSPPLSPSFTPLTPAEQLDSPNGVDIMPVSDGLDGGDWPEEWLTGEETTEEAPE